MTIKVFASGQSNMLGRGTGGPSFSGVSSDVRVWNNINPLGSNGTSFVTASAAQAAGVFQDADKNNLAVWFCDKLARTQLDTVDLTLVALGGGQISYWDPSEVTWPMFNECVSVWTATGQGPADVFLWHQGEADVATAPSSYIAQFMALVQNLIDADVLSESTKIILGGIAEDTEVDLAFNYSSLLALCGGMTTYATSYQLGTTDGAHFTGQGLYMFGSRAYFSAYLLAKSLGD